MKPTYGTVSRYGLVAYASSLDQIGPICQDAADCAAVLDVISGWDRHDGTSLDFSFEGLLDSLNGDVKGMKIGLPSDCFAEGLEPDVKEKVLAAAKVFEGLGAEVDYFPMPSIKYVVPTYYIVACAEASSNLSRFDGVKYGFRAEEYEDIVTLLKNTRSEGFGKEVQRRILLGTFVLSTGYYDAYYKKALQVKAVIKNAFDAAFEKYDLILSPVAPTTAPKLGESLSDPLKMYLSDIYTVSINLAACRHCPCRAEQTAAGLPVGVQLVGQRLRDSSVLNAAYAFQQATDFHQMTPKGAM
jgi:aspartyl-tRNA(Asn)/glutamyl-tRNA(Gln) amidotransferase subunit A